MDESGPKSQKKIRNLGRDGVCSRVRRASVDFFSFFSSTIQPPAAVTFWSARHTTFRRHAWRHYADRPSSPLRPRVVSRRPGRRASRRSRDLLPSLRRRLIVFSSLRAERYDTRQLRASSILRAHSKDTNEPSLSGATAASTQPSRRSVRLIHIPDARDCVRINARVSARSSHHAMTLENAKGNDTRRTALSSALVRRAAVFYLGPVHSNRQTLHSRVDPTRTPTHRLIVEQRNTCPRSRGTSRPGYRTRRWSRSRSETRWSSDGYSPELR